jgi:hypothetical protein
MDSEYNGKPLVSILRHPDLYTPLYHMPSFVNLFSTMPPSALYIEIQASGSQPYVSTPSFPLHYRS